MRPGLPFNAVTILLFLKSCIFPFSMLMVITLITHPFSHGRMVIITFNFVLQSSETVETMTKLLDLAGYVFSFLCPSLSLIVHLSSYDKVSADTACLFPKYYKKSDGSKDARRGYPDMPN